MTGLSRPTIGRARRLFFVVLVLDVLVDLVVAVTATLAFIDRGILAAGIFAAIGLAIIAEGVLEFPTGVLADRFGRGRSVALSFVARGIANVVLLATDTLYGLLAAQLLLAFGVTLASGALVSWGVDVAYKGEEDLDPLFKRVEAASLAAVAAGYGVGGLLGDADLTIPFGVAGLLCLIGAAVAWCAVVGETGGGRDVDRWSRAVAQHCRWLPRHSGPNRGRSWRDNSFVGLGRHAFRHDFATRPRAPEATKRGKVASSRLLNLSPMPEAGAPCRLPVF